MRAPPGGLRIVTEIAGQAVEAATGDFLTIEGEVFRQVKDPETGKVFLVPVKVEAHVNPASIIGGIAAGLLGVLLGTVAWHGVSFPTALGGSVTLFKGVKDTQLGEDVNRWYERLKVRRMGAEIVESRINLSQEEKQRVLEENIGDATCQLLNREWAKAHRRGDFESEARFLQQAKDGGCPWAKQF